MTPSLWFALACLAVVLLVDAAFWLRYLPGDTISQALASLTARHPLPWHVG